MQSVKILALCASVLCTSPSAAQSCLVPNPVASKKQMEHLDRGLVVVRGQKAGQYFASWRLLGTEPASASFTLCVTERLIPLPEQVPLRARLTVLRHQDGRLWLTTVNQLTGLMKYIAILLMSSCHGQCRISNCR